MELYQENKKLKVECNSIIEILNDDVWTILGPYMYEAYKNTITNQPGHATTLPLIKGGFHYNYLHDFYVVEGISFIEGLLCIGKELEHEDLSQYKIAYFCHLRCELMLVCKKFYGVFSTIKLDELFWITSLTASSVFKEKQTNAKLFRTIINQVSLVTNASTQMIESERVKGVVYCFIERITNTTSSLKRYKTAINTDLKGTEFEEKIGWTDTNLAKLRSLKYIEIFGEDSLNTYLNSLFSESLCSKITIDSKLLDKENPELCLSLLKHLKEMKIYLNFNTSVKPDHIPASVKNIELCYYEKGYDKQDYNQFDVCVRLTIHRLANRVFDVVRLDVRHDFRAGRSRQKSNNMIYLPPINAKRMEIYYDDTNYFLRWDIQENRFDEILFEFDMSDAYLGYNDDHRGYFKQNKRAYLHAIRTCKRLYFKKVIFSIVNNYSISAEFSMEKLTKRNNIKQFELRLSNAPLSILHHFENGFLQASNASKSHWEVKSNVKQVYDFKSERGGVIKMCYAELIATYRR
jgi:hypothetical protein